ncbi:MAG: YgiQ family radical SAM protein [Bacteroidales bacterium]|jgi:uncharacterized radical SAM protein YgiQ|nr:YgiQ family radical SAM protein [Bacteroidales bacterium]
MFLPITKEEVTKRGWSELDVVIVSGDAYIDHPSFGSAVIGRTLEADGLRVAILPQPNWQDDLRDFKKFGKPRLFFGVTGGSMDSMVNHYTAAKRLRNDDAYTPGGKSGFRPDYAVNVYSKILKQLFPQTPVILGGIEASLRRASHYDYWADRLFPSILISSQADMLVYGMGEKIIRNIAALLDRGVPMSQIRNLKQTAFVVNADDSSMNDYNANTNCTFLPSFVQCTKDKSKQAEVMSIIERNANSYQGNILIQNYGQTNIVINQTDNDFGTTDLDNSFDLPYERRPHPKYNKRGQIPAFEMIKHSVNIHRGCFGGCAFCTIAIHQGKTIISRSETSILKEIKAISQMPDFKGYLTDLGGPSANMYLMGGKDKTLCRKCRKPSCIHPSICSNLDNNHEPLLSLYAKVRSLPYIKKVFIGSGIRYDIFTDNRYFDTLFRYHVSGRLKVAPEHTEDNVLKAMRKPSFDKFIALKHRFDMLNKRFGMKQQLIPYFISSHPACSLKDMALLAQRTASLGYRLEQVQDFTPTPMTIATEMYYTGFNPQTMEKMFCVHSKQEKQEQNRIFFWYKPENRSWAKTIFRKYNLPLK